MFDVGELVVAGHGQVCMHTHVPALTLLCVTRREALPKASPSFLAWEEQAAILIVSPHGK